jgi:hypothetical protein
MRTFLYAESEKPELTCIHSLLLYVSRAKRDSFTLECVLRTFWDCKLELNFVPVYRVVAFGEGGQRIGNKIEFFCRLNCTLTTGSLTSTYKGSKKIQL